MIYVVRNPKDNAVSYFHHHRMSTYLGNYKGSWDTYVDLFAKGHLVHGDWFSHVNGYWQLAQQFHNRILFVAYEELKTVSFLLFYCDHNDSPSNEGETGAAHFIELHFIECSFHRMSISSNLT